MSNSKDTVEVLSVEVASRATRRRTMDRLADLIEQALRARPVAEAAFKPPRFDGSSDVELFVEQFTAVQQANRWNAEAALLHLRSALEGSAREFGRGETLPQVFASLRARYGLSVRQARDHLASMRWERGQSVQALGVECQRLTGLAYPELPEGHRETLATETMRRCLSSDKTLSRHLLAVNAVTVQQITAAAQAFLQVGSSMGTTRGHAAMAVAEDDCPTGETLQQQLSQLAAAVQQNAQAIARLSNSISTGSRRNPLQGKAEPPAGRERQSNESSCYGCGAKGHFKRNCPTLRKPGNGKSPQQ